MASGVEGAVGVPAGPGAVGVALAERDIVVLTARDAYRVDDVLIEVELLVRGLDRKVASASIRPLRKARSSASSSGSTTPLPVSPCVRALRREAALPSSVFGPVLDWALRSLACCWRRVVMMVARGGCRHRCGNPFRTIVKMPQDVPRFGGNPGKKRWTLLIRFVNTQLTERGAVPGRAKNRENTKEGKRLHEASRS